MIYKYKAHIQINQMEHFQVSTCHLSTAPKVQALCEPQTKITGWCIQIQLQTSAAARIM